MYRKELNERSPLRIFERSLHGGLGKGNLGVVMSRAGVGKTAILIGIALDDLMRERKVLHINLDDSAEKVREFYDEVFHDLAEGSKLKNRENAHLVVERHRMILSYSSETFHLDKLRESLSLLKEQMNFEPESVVIDGYPDFTDGDESPLQELKKLAVAMNVEMWVTALTHREGDELDARGVPAHVSRFEEYLSVIVNLEPMAGHVKLAILKDHDNQDIADLHLELDPSTLLLQWR